jgi:hypothetical protein
MKRYIGMLLIALSVTACDDGDITLQSFDFEAQNIQNCNTNELLFKIKGSELLLVTLPNSATANAVTPENQPRVIQVNTTNQVLYRKYSGNLTNATICSAIPPSSPSVSKEWIATGGTIEVITSERRNANDELIGYTHNIRFVNINFSSSDDSFSFVSYIFGNYQTNL